MTCTRCGGLIVQESVYDNEGSSQTIVMTRCLQCGNIEDAVSARNRAQSSDARARKPTSPRLPGHTDPSLGYAPN